MIEKWEKQEELFRNSRSRNKIKIFLLAFFASFLTVEEIIVFLIWRGRFFNYLHMSNFLWIYLERESRILE